MSRLNLLFMKVVSMVICIYLIFCAPFGKNRQQDISNRDSLFIQLPTKYDTLNISYLKMNVTRIVLDRFSQKNYTAPDGISLDVRRQPSFKLLRSNLGQQFKNKIVDISILSDSLRVSNGSYLKRHQFFVMIYKNDSIYFYNVRGEYLNKNQ
jgi:hypothetical protein